MRSLRFFITAFLWTLACLLPARAALPDAMRSALRAAGLPESSVGAVVIRARDGAAILVHRSAEGMQPASTLKPLTALVALERLGPAYRGRTELRAAGDAVDGVLRGNLVLRGLGNVDFDWRAFERLLGALRLQGVREIDGDFLVDLSWFRPARADVGAPPFDAQPEFRYNVIPDALLLNTYLIDLDIVTRGDAVRMIVSPALEGVSVVQDFKLVERDCEDWEDGWKLPAVSASADGAVTIKVRGEFPRECTATTAINVIDRIAFADRLFRSLWMHMGGTFRGRTREGAAPAGSRVVAEHVSRPLSQVVLDVNKRSDNPITRVVYLTLGARSKTGENLDTALRSEREVRRWLAEHDIGSRGLVLDNGSGLSRSERITPAQLAAVLRAGLSSPWAPEFLASFPIAGVDGAMRGRLQGSAAAAQARIKTGTLVDVSAIAGYVKDEAGDTHVAVAMINHPLADRKVARPILDILIEWVARRSAREPDPAPARAF
jgi:D-alanyl-D-alanine carboxypeptidase/D-alanyl-D-alanine-endopeptidase (penicillin-binding protein 4)